MREELSSNIWWLQNHVNGSLFGNYENCPNYKELLRDDREFKR